MAETVKMLVVGALGCAALAGLAAEPAAEPTVELYATATNLVVTENACVGVRLWLPPLKDDFADVPPFVNQKPPHVEAAFLEPGWKPTAVVPSDPRRQPPVETRSRDRNVPVYTLNNYVSDDFFGDMRDPFAMMDEDFFGRTLGPKQQRFPFRVSREERGGVKGWAFSFETAPYRAVTPGRVEIASVAVKVPLILEVKTRTMRDRFGRAVQRAVPTFKEVVLRTHPLVVEVLEPPAAGRPGSYCGAIASNLTVKATLDASVCMAGDPLVLTLDVAGASDAAAVHPPSFASALAAHGVFRLDEASLKTETLAASRRFSWRVRALKTGTVEFPALSVSYYNLGTRAYVTCRTETIPVQVKAGAQATLGALDETGGEAEVYPLPDGVDLDLRGAACEPLLPHLGLAIAIFVVPPFVFLLVRLAPPVRRRVAARRAAARRAGAFARCRKALVGRDDAKREAAIRRFFADRYGVNGASVTAGDARRLMAGDFTDEEIALVADALAAFDRTNFSLRKTVVSLLVVALACCGAWAASPEFTYRRAASLATHAVDEAGFRKAAAAYADCVAAGAANPVLFSNLGGCALMAGDARGALAAYGRAERRGGETATTRRGTRAAWARLKGDPRADPPLVRQVCGPHVWFSLDARLLALAGAWALGWLVLLLPPGAVRRLALTMCGVVALALLVSVGVSLVEEHAAEGVVYAAK